MAKVLKDRRGRPSRSSKETDHQRLDRAFDSLRAAGIVALQKAGDTVSDGHTMVADESDDDARGYCFFHRQDVDRCRETGDLYLAFGGLDEPGRARKATDAEIGAEVRERLRTAGLDVHWTGKATERICVRRFAWNPRHRPARAKRSPKAAPAIAAGAAGVELPAWNRLERLAAKIAPDVVALLNAGCDERQIAEVERELGVRFPEDYRRALKLHNGQKTNHPYLPSVFGGRSQFLSVRQVLQIWQAKWHKWRWDASTGTGRRARLRVGRKVNDRGIAPVDSNLRWIPIVGSIGNPDYHCLDLDPGKGGRSGQIIFVHMNLLGDAYKKQRNRLVAPSFTAFLDGVAGRLERKQFTRKTEVVGKARYRAFELEDHS